MSVIVKKGKISAIPHTEFYAVEKVLALEEIHGTYGFSGPYTRKLHVRAYPTEQLQPPVKADYDLVSRVALVDVLQPYHILSSEVPFEACPMKSRKPILFGTSTIISISKPVHSMSPNTFFRNGEKHEAYYVQDGTGELKTEYGSISFRKGLYLIIPKGTIYQIELTSKNAYFLIMESIYPVEFPPHYMNKAGQATLMAPVVETEIDVPMFQQPIDKSGEYFIDIKHDGGHVTRLTLDHHPFDIAGWEGAVYPFGFDIKNHHGIAREIHTAPPVHQTFQAGNVPFNGISICSFVSQMEGWHPKDVAAPFAHSNVDSDEVMFFSSSDYGAREGVIKEGSITFHPGSIPHSPHGDSALRSMNDRGKMNKRLAVMVDTYFESIRVTDHGYKYSDKDYSMSWYKAKSKIGSR